MKVYHPQIKVWLIKSQARNGVDFNDAGIPVTDVAGRYKETASKRIDLTPYLGDGGGVRTSKSVREPAGGFTITLLDLQGEAWSDTIYSLIEPMDMVEIRFCHDASQMANKEPPIVMRGFVSEIRRDEAMGQDGKPSRKVVISGQDSGKLLQIYLIYYLNNLAIGEAFLTGYNFLQKFGEEFGKQQEVAEFFVDVVNEVLNPFMKSVVGVAKDDALKNGFVPLSTISGAISPFILSSFKDVSLYQMLRSLFDVGAFNEMYVEDRPTSVALILRPAPFYDTTGKAVQADASVEYENVPENDIQSLMVSRSDSQVGNWFWVQNNRWMMVNDIQNQLYAQSANVASVDKRSYPNCAEAKFGFRNMHESVSLGPPTKLVNDTSSGTAADVEADNMTMQTWLDNRRIILGDMNKDNAVFESGTMRIRGNELVKAGMILKVERGEGRVDQYYAVGVDHDFVPFQGFFTTVQFERGTGFISRAQSEISPYFTEWDRGGVK